jgi:hypothetical protein
MLKVSPPPQRALSVVEDAILEKIMLGNTECTIDDDTASSEFIQCTFAADTEIATGSWEPKVVSNLGVIPVKAGLDKYEVKYTLTSIAPNQDLNVLGNDNITITGTNFPTELKRSVIEIEFSDATKTKCVPQFTSLKKIVCLTSKFDKPTALDKTLNVKITINSLVVASNFQVKM